MLIQTITAYMESMDQSCDLEKPSERGDEATENTSYLSLQAQRNANTLPTPSPATSLTLVNSGSAENSSLKRGKSDDDDEDDEELRLSCGDIDDNELRLRTGREGRAHKKLLKQGVQRAHIKSHKIGEKLKEELTKYKQELKEYNETTKELEEKYMKINYELSEMQQKHDHFVATRAHSSDVESEADGGRYYASSTSLTSNMSVPTSQGAKVFSRSSSFMTVLEAESSCDQITKRELNYNGKSKSKTKSCLSAQVRSVYSKHIVETLANRQAQRRKRSMLGDDLENKDAALTQNTSQYKEVYHHHVLKDVINTPQDHKHKHERDTGEITQLYSALKNLKSEQVQYRSIIRQQQDRISDYHTRCVKAQEIMKTQKHEIDKLNVNNKQLENSIYQDFDDLRTKIDAKLKSISHLPQLMREEHSKYEKVMRENCLLVEKLRSLQEEASQLKIKIDELGRRKLVTINRLKAAERDLKIFKNYNSALKSEKRRMAEELATMKEQLNGLQATNKRQLTRHRDQSEKQRRELQKRIFDLELKLSRSQNSTASLIQERDSLIAELQTQLHTLVHNFEVSQKHIRVLRRHIYSMTSSGGATGIPNAPPGSQRSSEAGIGRANQLAAGSSASRLGNPRTLKTKA
ncbi:golgin-84 [Scaptodrosophila lebanonensis]|uniref:Golgin-84 n=1 Tax=Drosophila lebanonensis TaxID=7225 RepID=A0A6J2U7H8_DROLE|nr:golgin-84 [Scaptodrosophila lebanonensis]